MNKREYKGSSIILRTDSYTVVDIETTGLSPYYDEIIEIAAIKYKDGVEIDHFSSLVKPSPEYGCISEVITKLTGITNEMLSTAPKINDVLPEFKKFIGNDILIGHNISSFDINFLYDACVSVLNEPLINDFIDTMRISRKLFSNFMNHKLQTLCQHFNIVPSTQHRALADCISANQCYVYMSEYIKTHYTDVTDFYNLFKKHKHKLSSKDLTTIYTVFDDTHPLYEKKCVFTGTLQRMERKDAMQAVLDVGGIPWDRVTQDTNFLIMGSYDYCKSIKDGKTSKHKKAEEYKLKGFDIETIDEFTFYDMLEEKNVVLDETETESNSTLKVSDTEKIYNLLKNKFSEIYSGTNINDYIKYEILKDNKSVSFTLFKTNLMMKFIFLKDKCRVLINEKYKSLIPQNLNCYKMSSDNTVCFDINDISLLNCLDDFYKSFCNDCATTDIGCCHRYVECSDALHCLNDNIEISFSCAYRQNLLNGKIFYGKNKNI